jgi:hypothetical protein
VSTSIGAAFCGLAEGAVVRTDQFHRPGASAPATASRGTSMTRTWGSTRDFLVWDEGWLEGVTRQDRLRSPRPFLPEIVPHREQTFGAAWSSELRRSGE